MGRRGPTLVLALGMATAMAGASWAAQTYPGNQGDSWAAIAKLPPLNGLYEIARARTAPKDGPRDTFPQLTPPAEARLKLFKDVQAKGGEQDKQTANCLPPGMPQIMDQPYPIQILLTPGEVTIIQEAYMQVRHVHMDGRPHADNPDLTFNGDSIGHWEGDTLVVDTAGLIAEAILKDGVQHTPQEHIVERIRLADPNALEIRTTIEDSAVMAKPWSYVNRYARHPDWSMAEYICEQNNRNSVDANGEAGINLKLK
jgi:hypothetical protein